jgi:hypothetical protein
MAQDCKQFADNNRTVTSAGASRDRCQGHGPHQRGRLGATSRGRADRPRHDEVEFAPRSVLQHAVEGWTLVPALGGAADTVILVDRHLGAHALGDGASSRSWLSIV